MTLDDLLDVAHPFLIRLSVPFRGVRERLGVIFIGPHGWGEFAPFPDYDDAAASRWLDCAVEAAFGTWPRPTVKPGITSVAVNAIIPAVARSGCEELVSRALAAGQSVFKIKVGTDVRQDLERIRTIVELLESQPAMPRWSLRLDANGTWSAHSAIELLHQLDRQLPGLLEERIEYLEQPTADPEGLRRIRQETGARIAVDELLRRATDPFDMVEQVRSCADVVIVKAAPLGGVRRCVELAQALDLPVVVSGSLDSSVGLGPGIALAGALAIDRACGLGTSALLATDLCEPSLLPIAGRLAIARPEGSAELLERASHALDTAQRAELLSRVANAWYAGTQGRWQSLVAS